jgi:hypothetical protein
MADSYTDVKLEKYTYKYWCDELKASKDDRQQFIEIANRSIKVYKREHKLDDCERQMSVWWSLVNTLLPAYFSRIPKVDVELRKKRGKEEERLAGLIWEAGTQYAIEEHFDFQSIGYQSVLQFILTGQGVLWARYQATFEPKDYEFALIKGDDDSYSDAKGNKYDGETYEKDGRPHAKETIETKSGERAIIDNINYNDFRTSVSRSPEEISWKARRSYLDRAKCYALFGKEKAELFNYNSYPEEKAQDKKESHDFEGKAEVWEIWCKDSEKVYHLHQGGKEKFCEASDIPVKYNGFWPCIEINANTEPNSVVPFSDYKECEDLLVEVERLTTRIHATIQAIRANFIYDAILGDKVEQLLEGDLKGLPVTQSASMKQKGGLGASIEFLDIAPFIQSLEILIQSREQTLSKLYEITAASDLIRGQTVAVKTATANQLESNYASLRFSVRREQVAKFLTGGIKKIGEIIASKFDSQTIYEMSQGEEISAQIKEPSLPSPSPGQPPMQPAPIPPYEKFKLLIAILKDNTLRNYKLDIESDSIVELDQRADRAERVDAMTSAGAFLNQLEPLIQKAPAAAQYAKAMMRFVMRSYKAGKEIEGELMGALDAMIMQIQQANQNQQDPKAAENAAKMQIAQMDNQIKQQELQLKMTLAQLQAQQDGQKLQIEMADSQFDRELKAQEVGIKGQEAQLDYMIEIEKLNIERMKLQQATEIEAVNMQLKGMQESFNQKIEQAYLKLDEYSVVAKENEKLIEEKRLASEERIETMRVMSEQIAAMNEARMSAQSEPKEPKEKPQPVVVNLHTGGGKQREVVVKRSKDGSLVGRTRDLEEGEIENERE